MALTAVSGESWGTLWDRNGNVLVGQLASINTTVYTTAAGITVLAPASFITNSNGALPGYVADGDWTLTVNATNYPASTSSGVNRRRRVLSTFGHSYNDPLALLNIYVARDGYYGARLAARLGVTEDNYCVSGTGSNAGETPFKRISVNVPAPATATPMRAPVDMAAIYHGYNDAANGNINGIGSPTETSVMGDYLRCQCYMLRAGIGAAARLHATWSFAQGGGGSNWSEAINVDYFGQGFKQANANGNTWTITLPADFPGGEIGVVGVTYNGSGALHTLTVDGGAAGTWDTRGSTTAVVRPKLKRITGLTAGAHTIVGTISNINTLEWLIAYYVPHTDPPPIAYALINRTYLYPAGTPPNVQSDTAVANINAAISPVAAEFTDGRVVAVDTDAVLQKLAVNFGADGIHPSDVGHDLIAIEFEHALRAVPGFASLKRGTEQAVTVGTRRGVEVRNSIDARAGVATLVSGTATITTRAITADCRVFLQPIGSVAAMGQVVQGVRTATNGTATGTLTILSKDAAGATVTGDTRSVEWFIVQPI